MVDELDIRARVKVQVFGISVRKGSRLRRLYAIKHFGLRPFDHCHKSLVWNPSRQDAEDE
jgi:hypothetical protein